MTSTPRRRVRCAPCGFTWQTIAAGRTVSCRKCSARVYVPVDPRAAVPLQLRPYRHVSCRHCGHSWATRRPAQSSVPCSQCGCSVWVSRSAPIVPAPVPDPPAPRVRTARPAASRSAAGAAGWGALGRLVSGLFPGQ